MKSGAQSESSVAHVGEHVESLYALELSQFEIRLDIARDPAGVNEAVDPGALDELVDPLQGDRFQTRLRHPSELFRRNHE